MFPICNPEFYDNYVEHPPKTKLEKLLENSPTSSQLPTRNNSNTSDQDDENELYQENNSAQDSAIRLDQEIVVQSGFLRHEPVGIHDQAFAVSDGALADSEIEETDSDEIISTSGLLAAAAAAAGGGT